MAKKPSEAKRWWNLAYKAAAILAAIGVGFVARWAGVEPKVVVKTVEVERPADDYVPTMGWHRDEAVIAQNLDPVVTAQFAETPAGRAVLAGDEDVFLWRAVRKAAGLPPDRYPNVNQGPVGSCVGAGNKHCVDVLQAVQIAAGARAEWKPVSVEVIYAGSRVEVGGGRIRGDGSVGAWAAKWLKDYGVVPMEQVGPHDLSSYSPSRARSWGRTGVPDDLEPAARQHPVKGTALVKSWQDVDRAIRQGYPVAVCSDQGFSMDRDREGFADRQGRWAHCMAIVGTKGGRRPGAFVLNSWGDNAHTGPRWPDDAPPAGFWADTDVIDRMVRQGDSFALSDVQGFPSRKLPDWFLANPRPARGRPLDLFAHNEVRIAP
jgi:hypothetical protein